MLVLTRKVGEAIAIGDDVKVTVLGVHDGKARIGIDAPREVRVMRTELLDRPLEDVRRGDVAHIGGLAPHPPAA